MTFANCIKAAAKHEIDVGPSVLFDALAVLVSALLAKDFVSDAFAHCKFIGVGAAAEPIFVTAGIAEDIDDACRSARRSTPRRSSRLRGRSATAPVSWPSISTLREDAGEGSAARDYRHA